MQTVTPNPSWTTRFEGPVGHALIALAVAVLLGTALVGVRRGEPMMIAAGIAGIAQILIIKTVFPSARTHQGGGMSANAQHPEAIDPTPSTDIDAERARELLDQAERADSATRSGASLGPSAFLLALGAQCSMTVVAIHLLGLTDQRLFWLVMAVLISWIGILSAAMLTSIRYVKAGFGRRWVRTIIAWGILWTMTMVGTTSIWRGELWFTVVSIVALTVLTIWGAWREARQ